MAKKKAPKSGPQPDGGYILDDRSIMPTKAQFKRLVSAAKKARKKS